MKKVILALGLIAFAVSSQASYLWWTVSGTENGFDTIKNYVKRSVETGGLGLTAEDMKAQVVAVKGNERTVLSNNTPGLFDEDWSTTPAIAANLGDLKGDGYSYYIEIVKANDGSVLAGFSKPQFSYTDVANSGAITDSLSEVPAMNVWHGGGTFAVPEPTSAVLMLLGVAGLALRRKQRNAA